MFTRRFTRDYDPRRLRRLLVALFLALAIPTGAVVWQAYGQLKFEAYYQYRNQAEALAERIDTSLIAAINQAEARRFTDFAFLNVAGDPAAKMLQRSPLAAYPVTRDVPGVLGYFQVGADGEFSTPLLPAPGTSPGQVGLSLDEYAQRTELAATIQMILADNRLVRERPLASGRLYPAAPPTTDRNEYRADSADQAGEREIAAGPDALEELGSIAAPASEPTAADRFAVDQDRPTDESRTPRLGVSSTTQTELRQREEGYSQQVFDALNQPARNLAAPARPMEREATALGGNAEPSPAAQVRDNAYGKLEDLELDEGLQKKSEVLERRDDGESARPEESKRERAARARRVEKVALPETDAPSSFESADAVSDVASVRISTFESEIDPFEFSLLDSGHLVLFRKVWRNGERYIQGLLIDRRQFMTDAIETAYRATTLSEMSDLIIGYQNDVVSVLRGGQARSYAMGAGELKGTLLHRGSLSAPFDGLELVFSINRLPPGAGARVLAWTTIVIAIVFMAGFVALYRLGLGQIRLARQQQDFVSAVSHELKTPLTSIRMYGEMLKEGWADEDKRKQYYDYIHDESERLTRLISNVLKLAKITRNEPQFELTPATVGELLNQIESKIASQVERSGFRLSFSRREEADAAMIRIDDDCFAQIIINLVDNAIKFSKDADVKAIEIGSTLTGDGEALFTVRDHGPGVPRDQMKKIFRLFYRTESELTRETVGTGIGLAIVHQLTLAMNGRVDVINRNPGAEFRISFPLVSPERS